LAVRANGMAVYVLLALKNPFPLMSVFSSVKNQDPVHSNGVGSYSMKIPNSMDRENVLFWIGQRFTSLKKVVLASVIFEEGFS